MPQFDTDGVLAVVLFVVGVVVSSGLYFLAKRDINPRWVMTSTGIFDLDAHAISDVDVRFGGHTIRRLAVTNLVFWNSGRAPISKADVSKSSPLRIEAVGSDTELLDLELVAVSDDGCGVEISGVSHHKVAAIDFQYLNHRDCFTVKVLHTGKAAPPHIELKGGFRGAGSPFYSVGTWWPFWGWIGLGWLIFVAGLFLSPPPDIPTWVRYLFVAEYPTFMVLIFLLDYSVGKPPRRFRLRGIPDNFWARAPRKAAARRKELDHLG